MTLLFSFLSDTLLFFAMIMVAKTLYEDSVLLDRKAKITSFSIIVIYQLSPFGKNSMSTDEISLPEYIVGNVLLLFVCSVFSNALDNAVCSFFWYSKDVTESNPIRVG